MNLFDTRGGIAMLDRCEECNESIPDDNITGLCQACLEEWDVCDDDE